MTAASWQNPTPTRCAASARSSRPVARGRDARRSARDAGAQGRRQGGVLSGAMQSDAHHPLRDRRGRRRHPSPRWSASPRPSGELHKLKSTADDIRRFGFGETPAFETLIAEIDGRFAGLLPLLPQLLDLARQPGRLCAGSLSSPTISRPGRRRKAAAAAGRGHARARRLLHPPFRRHAECSPRRPSTRGSASSIPTPSRSTPPMARISTRWRTPAGTARGER